jgi:hypothetical protein
MKIENMTKEELAKAIMLCEKKLNDNNWIMTTSNFQIGVFLRHKAKLINQKRILENE